MKFIFLNTNGIRYKKSQAMSFIIIGSLAVIVLVMMIVIFNSELSSFNKDHEEQLSSTKLLERCKSQYQRNPLCICSPDCKGFSDLFNINCEEYSNLIQPSSNCEPPNKEW